MDIRSCVQGESRGDAIDANMRHKVATRAKGLAMGEMAAGLAVRAGDRPSRPRAAAAPRSRMRELLTGLHTLLEISKKICVLGDPAVGKTSLIRRYALDTFDENYTTTVGARVLTRTQMLQYPDQGVELRLRLRIWEISGQNRHLELYPAYYRGADGAIIVGDAARPESQVNLWKWIEGFRSAAGQVPVMLLLNKTDILAPGEFDHRLLDEMSQEYGCPCRVASARDGTNVDRVFRELAYRLIGRRSFSEGKMTNAC